MSSATGTPVLGFLAILDLRLFTENTPKPRNSMRPPLAKISITEEKTPSTTALVSTLVRPVCAAICSTMSALVIVLTTTLMNKI